MNDPILNVVEMLDYMKKVTTFSYTGRYINSYGDTVFYINGRDMDPITLRYYNATEYYDHLNAREILNKAPITLTF